MRKSGSQQMPTSPKGARGPSPAHKPPKPKIQKFSKMPEDTNKIAEAKENMVLLTNSQGVYNIYNIYIYNIYIIYIYNI